MSVQSWCASRGSGMVPLRVDFRVCRPYNCVAQLAGLPLLEWQPFYR